MYSQLNGFALTKTEKEGDVKILISIPIPHRSFDQS